VRKSGGLKAAIKRALKHSDRAIVEEYISGRELTVAVLSGRALPIIEIRPKAGLYDYKAKYTKGLTEFICPAMLNKRLEARVKDIALSAYNGIGCRGAARVDIMLDKRERPYVLEVNTVPGLTELSLFPRAAREAGIDYPELVEMMLKDAFAGRGKR
jgi:D-alanine-D-alanine ligase